MRHDDLIRARLVATLRVYDIVMGRVKGSICERKRDGRPEVGVDLKEMFRLDAEKPDEETR